MPTVELGMGFVFDSFKFTRLQSIYLGGLPSNIHPVTKATPFHPFDGCIGEFEINGKEYGFMDAVIGVNGVWS